MTRRRDKVVDPGKAYDAASRSENIETEETEFKSIANDILNEDLDCEDGSNNIVHGTTQARPN